MSGVFFGLLVGWIIGSQQAVSTPAAAPPATTAAAAPAQSAPALDENRAASLRSAAERDPQDAESRVQLGNLYFDAERYTDAVKWYEEAAKLSPKDVNVSTDLGISYYYTNRTDEALKRFEESLRLNPKHVKTLLNKGIVLAFGKEDLRGAAVEWQRVVELAPGTPEGEAARRALEGVAAAHANQPAAAPAQQ